MGLRVEGGFRDPVPWLTIQQQVPMAIVIMYDALVFRKNAPVPIISLILAQAHTLCPKL